MKRSGAAPASFVRPALLEGMLLVTGASVAILSILAGDRINSTALVEFGMLSAFVATSAGVLFVRYAVEVCGIVASCRTFEHWSLRLNAAGYIVRQSRTRAVGGFPNAFLGQVHRAACRFYDEALSCTTSGPMSFPWKHL